MSLNLGVLSAAVTLSDTQYVNTLDNLEKKSESVFKKIGDAVTNYLTTNTIVSFVQDSVAAFRTQESAVESVRATLRNLGKESDLATARMGEFASEMQKITVYGDEGTLAAMAQGMRLGINPAEIENVTKAAMGLAAKIGTDLPTAMMLLARASKGQTQMLSRYGIALDETKSKEEQYQDILKAGVDSFPLVTAAADTATGKMTQFANALGDTKEVFGEQWQKALTDVITPLTGLLTEFNNADQATKSLVVSAASLTAGLVLLNNLGIAKLIKNTAVAIVSGNAHLLLLKKKTAATVTATTAEAAHAAALAATATAANLAVLALAALAAGLYAYYKYVEAKEQEMVDTAAKRMQTTRDETTAIKQLHGEHREHLERLQELSKYEKLTNEEQAEAKKLAEQLKKAYGDLGIAVDELNGKLSVSPEAFAKMEEAQKQNYLKQLSKELKSTTEYAYVLQKQLERQNTSRQWLGRKSDIGNLRENFKGNPEEQLEQYQKLLNFFTTKGWKPEIEITERIIKVLKEEIALRKKMIGARAGTEDSADKSEKNKGEERKKLEQIQKAISDVEKTELQIEFDSADTEKKAEMLRNQINEIFQKNKGTAVSLDDFLNFDRTRMTKEQLQALEQILKLRQQENNLIKQGADEAERKRKAQEKEIADARRRKEDIVEQNRDFIAEQAAQQIEIQLKNLQVSGDTAGYNALVQQELAKATQAAAKAQQEYMSAFAKIKNEQTVDKDTEEQLRKLLRTAQDAQQKQRAWEGKLNTDENADVQQEQTRKVVGAWSLAEFSRQQENSVESRIEKNTRETARLLKNSKGLVY